MNLRKSEIFERDSQYTATRIRNLIKDKALDVDSPEFDRTIEAILHHPQHNAYAKGWNDAISKRGR